MLVIEEVVRDSRFDEGNMFRCIEVMLNLLEMELYDSARYWIYKVRVDGSLVAEIFWY